MKIVYFRKNFKFNFMKTKNVFWVVVIAVLTSCTVSKRIDKWGYRVSFDKKKTSELGTVEQQLAEEKNVVTEKSTLTLTQQPSVLVHREVTSDLAVHLYNAVGNLEKTTPTASNQKVLSELANERKVERLEKKASKFIAKMNTNSAKAVNSSQPENWVYILLIFLVPFGTVISMYLYEGSWTKRVTVNLLLSFLCGLPGLIHALVVIFGNK